MKRRTLNIERRTLNVELSIDTLPSFPYKNQKVEFNILFNLN